MSSEEDAQQTAAASLRSSRRRKSPRVPRSALDTSLWTFRIRATRLRSLRLPTWAAVIRGVHVFTTLDKQARQSRGSKWRHEAATGPAALVGTRARSPVARRRRGSSMPEEVHWVQHDGELQWTLQRDRFRHLKAYSPRIKVYVYGLRTVTGAADAAVATTPFDAESLATTAKASENSSVVSFGWFFLDLRTPDLPERWMLLQSSPFGGEIQISTSLAPFNPNESPTVTVARPILAFQQTPAAPVTASMATTGSGEYLRLGRRNGTDVFIISVFIQSAFNLSEVVENAIGTRRESADIYRAGFWLSYSLFEVVVQTDVFLNLEVAEFAPIRDNFRVLSCLEDLQEFFQSQQQSLTVYLCTENRVLADVEIPMASLVAHEFFSSAVETDKQVKEASMDGTFAFAEASNAVVAMAVSIEIAPPPQSTMIESMEETKQDTKESQVRPAIEDATQGSELTEQEASTPISASIVFKLDHIRLQNKTLLPFAGKEEVSLELSIGTNTRTDAIAFCAFMEDHAIGENESLKTVVRVSETELSSLPIQVRCFVAATNATIAVYSATLEQAGITSLSECISGLSLGLPLLLGDGTDQLGECRLSVEEKLYGQDEEIESAALTQKGDVHVYRIFVNLKSMRDVETTPREVLLAFENPFNGKGRVESDLIEVADTGEFAVTKSMCTFEVTKTEQSFKQAMNSCMMIDLSEKRGDGSVQLVGNAIFSLNYLYFSQERFCCADPACGKTFQTVLDGTTHWEHAHHSTTQQANQTPVNQRVHPFKSCSIYVPIMKISDRDNAGSQQIGAVRVVAYVEDMGLLPRGSIAQGRSPLFGERHVARIFPSDMKRIVAMTSALESPSRATNIAQRQEPLVSSLSLSEPLEVAGAREVEIPSSRLSPAQLLQSTDHQHQRLLDLDEKMRDVMAMKESLERERMSWRQEQRAQHAEWKRRMAELEKARMDELEEEWARREEERSTLLRSTQGEYQRLEQTLRTSLVEMEKRERKLTESERNLQREQQTQREENELARKRMQSEHAHAMSLVQKQVEVHERRAKLLDEQVRDAEARAKQLETDFAEYRRQQRKVPEARLLEEIASLKGGMMELERQKMAQEKAREAAETQIEKLNAQVNKMTRLLHAEKHKNEARAVEEVEKLRVKYLAREEKYILDGDREELRAIKKQLETLRGLSLRCESRTADEIDHHQDYFSPSVSDDHRRHTGRDAPRARRSRHQQSTQKRPYAVRDRASDSGDHSSQLHSGRLASSFSSFGERDRADFGLDGSVSEVSMPDHDDIVLRHDEGDDIIEQGENGFDAAHTPHYEGELDRLTREKQLLLASGAYDEESYLVRELTRLIEETRAKTGFPQNAF